MLKKWSKAVYRRESIYRLGDVQKWQDEMSLDPEEGCKAWDCCEFIRHAKVLPPARLIRLKTRNRLDTIDTVMEVFQNCLSLYV